MASLSTNPTSIFRWEDSSALEHSCCVCTTKSNSPKAIQTCYGIHSVPCVAYHSTMHAVGTAHRCSGCAVSREKHDGRHREIAGLVAEFQAEKIALQPPPVRRKVLSERGANMRLRRFAPENEALNDNDHVIDEEMGELLNQDSVSTTTNNENHYLPKLSAAEKREQKRNIKERKSLDKAAKNEARHVIQLTSEDVKKVETVLHGEEDKRMKTHTHPLATDKNIEDVIARNLGFVKQIDCHKEALYESIRAGRKEDNERRKARQRASNGHKNVETEAVLDAILVKLGIDSTGESKAKKNKTAVKSNATPAKHTSPKMSSRQLKIVAKLRYAIRDDIEKHENDLRQAYIRAGGFFRYAGKTVFDRMTEIAKRIDLETGERLNEKVETEAQLELDAEEPNVVDDGDDGDDGDD